MSRCYVDISDSLGLLLMVTRWMPHARYFILRQSSSRQEEKSGHLTACFYPEANSSPRNLTGDFPWHFIGQNLVTSPTLDKSLIMGKKLFCFIFCRDSISRKERKMFILLASNNKNQELVSTLSCTAFIFQYHFFYIRSFTLLSLFAWQGYFLWSLLYSWAGTWMVSFFIAACLKYLGKKQSFVSQSFPLKIPCTLLCCLWHLCCKNRDFYFFKR